MPHLSFPDYPGFWIGVLLVTGLFAWFSADIRFILRWGAHRDELMEAMDWDGVSRFHERRLRTWRPFVRLLDVVVTPGSCETLYALDLNTIGFRDKALEMADRAIRRARRKPRILVHARRTRIIILIGLGRFEEVRGDCRQYAAILGPDQSPQINALLEFNVGKLDDALRIARKAIGNPGAHDAERFVATEVLSFKGDLAGALRILDYAPSRVDQVFTNQETVTRMEASSSGAAAIEAMRRKHNSVVQPARELLAAGIHLQGGDLSAARSSLNRVRRGITPQSEMKMLFHGLAAECAAHDGDLSQVDDELKSLWAIADRFPKRTLKADAWLYTGRAQLLLGRLDEADASLGEAEEAAVSPIARHVIRYWRGDCAQKRGRNREAFELYRSVIADGFGTWCERKAEEAIAEQSA